jgi:hypothetical protein
MPSRRLIVFNWLAVVRIQLWLLLLYLSRGSGTLLGLPTSMYLQVFQKSSPSSGCTGSVGGCNKGNDVALVNVQV